MEIEVCGMLVWYTRIKLIGAEVDGDMNFNIAWVP